jgi:hypothetical protein
MQNTNAVAGSLTSTAGTPFFTVTGLKPSSIAIAMLAVEPL